MEIILKIFRKKYVIALIAALIVIIGIVSICVINNSHKKQNNRLQSDDIIVEGNLGKAVSVSYSDISEDTDEYQNVNDKLDTDNLISFSIYNIDLLDKDDNKVQPDGTVRITINIPESLKEADMNDEYRVFRTEKDGELTKLDCEEENGKISFETSHFSVYTFAVYRGIESIKTLNHEIDEYVTAMDKTMYVLQDTSVWSGPNDTFDNIGSFVKNQEVKVVGQFEENGWYKVQLNDDTFGYVSSDVLTESKPETVVDSNNKDTSRDNDNSNTNIGSNNGGGSSSGGSNVGTTTPGGNNGGSSSSGGSNVGTTTPGSNNGGGSSSGGNNGGTTTPGSNNGGGNNNSGNTSNPPVQEHKTNNCPYPLLSWTTYQGHYGFFASYAQDSSGESMDMQVELSLKNNVSSLNVIEVGRYDDVGQVIFYY